MTPNNDHVICPNCAHQFRAIPVNVQTEITSLREQLSNMMAVVANVEWERDVADEGRNYANELLSDMTKERDEWKELAKGIDTQLRTELASVTKDAERYRELRSNELFSVDIKCPDGNWEPIHYEQLDAAIDEAMR